MAKLRKPPVATVLYAVLSFAILGLFLYSAKQPDGRFSLKVPSAPAVQQHTWDLSLETRAIDGVERQMVLINGEFPGPILRARRGETVEITVVNKLVNESTSIHWHGLRQFGSNHMDGVAGVTQCGIPPLANFTYVLKIDDNQPSGTFWYHSHVHTQRADGLSGPLIIEDEPTQAYSQLNGDYDEEVVVMLHDHYHREGKQTLEWYLSSRSRGREPVPDNGFINGKNVFECRRLKTPGLSCTDGVGKYSQFEFQRGKKYRLRIINASALANFDFSIDGHTLKVIEADSTEVDPVDVHYLPIASGQRYSVIVTAEGDNSVWMRAMMNEACFNYVNFALDPEIKAIVKIRGRIEHDLLKLVRRIPGSALVERLVGTKLPTSDAWEDVIPPNEGFDLDADLLKPVSSSNPPVPDIRFVVWVKSMKLERVNLAPFAFFNRTSWAPAIGAPNLQVELGHINASDTVEIPTVYSKQNTPKWGGDQMVLDVPYGSVVELVINNSEEETHPFHLHGHEFWVVHTHGVDRVGKGTGHWTPDQESRYKTDNPVRRDTVSVPRFGHAVLRWKADNPGIWAFHCHLLWHLAAGMMMQFNEGMDHSTETIPQAMLDHCAWERAQGEKLIVPLPGSSAGSKVFGRDEYSADMGWPE